MSLKSLDEQEMSDEPSGIDPIETNAKVMFDHVQFGYDQKELLMTDFNLAVKEGDMTAIVECNWCR